MIEFLLKYPEKIVVPLLQHLQITSITLLISFLVAVPVSLLVLRSRVLSQVSVSVFGVIYSIPSLALFALLIPFLGLGQNTAIFVLVIYNQYILVRSILAGFRSVDAAVIESAVGMGMSDVQLFLRIRLPLASPVILGGIKIAAVSTIGIATIAATINAGGLGTLLFDGLWTQNDVKILWGSLLASILAIAANILIGLLEKRSQQMVKGKK